MKKTHKAVYIIMPFLVIILSLFAGRYDMSVGDVLASLGEMMGLDVDVLTPENSSVVIQLRLPRAIAAAFVGAGLAASGAAYQGIFHNPLVSPGLLGVSAGAGFGASLAIVTVGVGWMIYPFAFLFGIIAVIMSYWVAGIYRTVPAIMLVLGGTIVGSIFNALISLLKYIADTDRQLPAIVYWLMGSLSSVGYENFWALVPVGLGCLVLLCFAWKINVLSMGDKEARSMGVNVTSAKLLVVAAATLATAGAVCISGVVGWIGLIIPHIGRMLTGNDNRRLIPVSMSVGASFMVVIDTVSRIIIESEIPLGILTSLIGAPFFIFLLKKTKGGGWRI